MTDDDDNPEPGPEAQAPEGQALPAWKTVTMPDGMQALVQRYRGGERTQGGPLCSVSAVLDNGTRVEILAVEQEDGPDWAKWPLVNRTFEAIDGVQAAVLLAEGIAEASRGIDKQLDPFSVFSLKE